MTPPKLISAIIVLLGGMYTAINVYAGGEPSPLGVTPLEVVSI